VWLVYVLLGVFAWIAVAVALDDPEAGAGRFIGLILLAFLVGMLAAVLQMEILTKPMTFCLPRERQTMRRFVFVVGLVGNALGALLFLFYPGLPFVWRLLVLVSACAAGMAVYLAGGLWIFHAKQPMALVGFLIAIFFFGQQLGLHIWLENTVVLHPLAVMAVGALTAFGMWHYLGRAELVRRICLRPWLGVVDVFDREKLRRSQSMREAAPWAKLKDHPRPWVESFFLAGMAASRPLGTARCAWGTAYTAFAVLISQWASTLVLALIVAMLLGYFDSYIVIVMASTPIVMGAMSMAHGVLYSSLLTFGGRTERFVSTLVVALTGTVLLTLCMGVVVALSVPLATVMPEIRWYGLHATYRVVSLLVLYGPWVLLPIVAAIHLIFYRRPILTVVAFMVVIGGLMVGLIQGRREVQAMADVSTAVALVLVCWLVFAAVVYLLATRRCLVR
jgi:hypothetical protein